MKTNKDILVELVNKRSFVELEELIGDPLSSATKAALSANPLTFGGYTPIRIIVQATNPSDAQKLQQWLNEDKQGLLSTDVRNNQLSLFETKGFL